jgi:hypothetical protein
LKPCQREGFVIKITGSNGLGNNSRSGHARFLNGLGTQ